MLRGRADTMDGGDRATRSRKLTGLREACLFVGFLVGDVGRRVDGRDVVFCSIQFDPFVITPASASIKL